MAADPASFTASAAAPHGRQGRKASSNPAGSSEFAQTLSWLNRRLGVPWSVRSLSACLGLALIIGWVAYFLAWGLGGSGRVGEVRLLADPGQPERFIGALSAIGFPLVAMLLGRALGRLERRAKIKVVRFWRRRPRQYRKRLRLRDFERRYRWLLGLFFGAALVVTIIWFQRGDVAAFIILFSWLAVGPVSGIAVARRFTGPTSQGIAALIAGFTSIAGAVLLILAFAGAGVSAFAFTILGVTNVAFTGAIGLLLDIVMGGMVTLGLALTGAGVATVALALAGAGTGIATLTGVATMSRAGLGASLILMSGAAAAALAFKEAATFSAAIGGISTLAVAAAVSHHRLGKSGAYAGAIGATALLILTAVLFGWGSEPLVIFAVYFFFLLPFLVGLTGWITLAVTRTLLGCLLTGRRQWPTKLTVNVVCWWIAFASTALLAFTLGLGAESYNQLSLARSGESAFDLTPMIEQTVIDPIGKGLWPSLLVLTPMIVPACLTTSLITDGLLALQPHDYRLRLVLFRFLGTLVFLAGFTGAIWFVTSVESMGLAPILGELAEGGTNQARHLWQAQSAP